LHQYRSPARHERLCCLGSGSQVQGFGGVWDPQLRKIAGFLYKRKNGLFSRGAWDKRFFVIDPEVDNRRSYQLAYYYKKNDFLEDVSASD
jgi:hypothetical protein